MKAIFEGKDVRIKERPEVIINGKSVTTQRKKKESNWSMRHARRECSWCCSGPNKCFLMKCPSDICAFCLVENKHKHDLQWSKRKQYSSVELLGIPSRAGDGGT